ncbi:MAG: T9SS type A sorting domain-containing protein [Bacteroidetes bacterium]|nr:T9SS type A sorting domain-containing protein [Bacteroidota bacterium]
MKYFTLYLFTFLIVSGELTAQGVWIHRSSFMGPARSDAAGFSIGTNGYVGLGRCSGTEYNDFWEYNPLTNTWTQKADYPGLPRAGATGFSIDSLGYIVGGSTGAGNVFGDLYQYDPSVNSWVQKNGLSNDSITCAAAMIINSKAYIASGSNDTGVVANSKTYEYDPLLDTWTQKANFPGVLTTRGVAFETTDKGYLSGGDSGSTDFWEYDVVSDSWTAKPAFPNAGNETVQFGFMANGKGYIESRDQNTSSPKFWEYNFQDSSWSSGPDFPDTANFSRSSFAIGTNGYVGLFNNCDPQFLEFNAAAYFEMDTIIPDTVCEGNVVNVIYHTNLPYDSSGLSLVMSPSASFSSATTSQSISYVNGEFTTRIPHLGITTPTAYFCKIVMNGNTFSSIYHDVIVIYPTPPSPNIDSNSPVCEGEDLYIYSNPSGILNNWTGPNGWSASQASPVIYNTTFTNNGIYSFYYVDTNGCQSAVTFTHFFVNHNPQANAGVDIISDTAVTVNGNVSGGTGPYDYLWSPCLYLSNCYIPNPFFSSSVPVNVVYYLSVTDANGCHSVDSMQVTFNVSTGEFVHVSGSVGIYPNPSKGSFHVKNIFLKENAWLQLINSFGEIVYAEMLPDKNDYIVYPNLPAGVYVLQLIADNRKYLQKIIIQ